MFNMIYINCFTSRSLSKYGHHVLLNNLSSLIVARMRHPRWMICSVQRYKSRSICRKHLHLSFVESFETLHNTQQQHDDSTIHYSTTQYGQQLPRKNYSSNNNNNSLDGQGLPSRSECTSTTSQIHILGLHLLSNYVTRSEKQVLLSVLTGPTSSVLMM